MSDEQSEREMSEGEWQLRVAAAGLLIPYETLLRYFTDLNVGSPLSAPAISLSAAGGLQHRACSIGNIRNKSAANGPRAGK
jgi:hypothetical protein